MTTLRWGILSTANIATEKVIPGIRRAARNESSRSPRATARRARRVADRLSIPRAHGSYEALLADPDVDAVYIPLPNHLHAEWTIAAARAGKHVLCEKPLALTAADAERMIEAAEAAGVQQRQRPPRPSRAGRTRHGDLRGRARQCRALHRVYVDWLRRIAGA